MKLSEFHVSIRSEGERLEEYSTEISPDGKKVACWIPSQTGKEFVVKYRDGKSSAIKGRGKSVHVYTDGHRMRKVAVLPHETHGKVPGVRISDTAMRPFVFADIQTTEEDTVPGHVRMKPDEIGTISVRVFLVDNWTRGRLRVSRIQDHPPVVINEREKKAGGHCVSLGDEQPHSSSAGYTGSYDSQKPDLVFEFHYRSIAMLQALGIIPPPKREAPLVIDLEDEDVQPPPKRQKTADNKDLVQSMQTELSRLRHRVGELEGNEAGPSGVKRSVIKQDPGDIIDLT